MKHHSIHTRFVVAASMLATCQMLFAATFDSGLTTNLSGSVTYNNLIIGEDLSNNQIILDSGATLFINGATELNSLAASITNNTLVVSDHATFVSGITASSKTNGIVIGNNTDPYKDSIEIGAYSSMEANALYLGDQTNETGSININGSEASLKIYTNVVIGSSGSDNTLTLSNGGTLAVGGNLDLGASNSSNNVITVNQNSSLTIQSLTNITIVSTPNGNALQVRKEGELHVEGDVKLTDLRTRDITMNSGAKLTIDQALEASRIEDQLYVTLNGSNANWNLPATAIVGENTAQNTLTLRDGATLKADKLEVGRSAGTTGNRLKINTGSLVMATNGTTVGRASNGNALDLNDGILETAQLTVGRQGNQNTLEQNGAGILQTDNVIIGDDGNHNTLIQKGGSSNTLNQLTIGKNGDQNTVTIEDDATYLQSTNLTLGIKSAGGNLLEIKDQASVELLNTVTLSNKNNAISLEGGAQAAFNNDLQLGLDSSNTQLQIDHATASISNNLMVGSGDGLGSRVSVEGTNALLSVGSLQLGSDTNHQNSVELTGGAHLMVATDFTVGSSSNSLSLSGSNTQIQVGNNLYLGSSTNSEGNTLEINAGAMATIGTNLYVGYTNSSDNLVQISGSNSMLTVSNQLYIGHGTGTNNAVNVGADGTLAIMDQQHLQIGTNNMLTIENGGILLSAGGWDFATQTNLSTNLVFESGAALELHGALSGTNEIEGGLHIVLNGTNSTWNTTANDALYIGRDTDNNALTLTNGVTFTASSNLWVGYKTDSNTLVVAGSNTALTASEGLIIGKSGQGNKLQLIEGSTTTAKNLWIGENESDNALDINGSNTTLNVGGNMWLGYDGGINTLSLSNAAAISVSSNLWIGYNAENNSMTASGSNTTLIVGDTLWLGYNKGFNEMTISDGATTHITSNLWIGYASGDNSLTLGTNASLQVDGDLNMSRQENLLSYNGTYYSDSATDDNLLKLQNGGMATVTGNVTLHNKSTLDIDSKSQMLVGGDFYSDETSILKLGISKTSTNNINLDVTGTATLAKKSPYQPTSQPNVMIYYEGSIDDQPTNNVKWTVLQAGALELGNGGATAGGLADLKIQTNKLTAFNLIVTNMGTTSAIMIGDLTPYSISEAYNLEAGQLHDVANEIDNLSDPRVAEMRSLFLEQNLSDEEVATLLDLHYGEKESAVPVHAMINRNVQDFVEQLNIRSDQKLARSTSYANEQQLGPAGPHTPEQPMQAWIKGFGKWGKKGATDEYEGYTGDTTGFIIGADGAFSDLFLGGIAGGSSSSSLKIDNGAEGSATTTYGSVYGALNYDAWFYDISLTHGRSRVDYTLPGFGTEADYDSISTAVYFGGGRTFTTDYIEIRPEGSVLANYYNQDAFDETSISAPPRRVERFSRFFTQSSLGGRVTVNMLLANKYTIRPEVRAFWLYNFNAREEDVPYQLIGGTETYLLRLQALESNLIQMGVGCSAKLTESIELRLDADLHTGDAYSEYAVSGALRYQF